MQCRDWHQGCLLIFTYVPLQVYKYKDAHTTHTHTHTLMFCVAVKCRNKQTQFYTGFAILMKADIENEYKR